MGRPKDKVWLLVYRDPDGKRWFCPYCEKSYAGSASRVKFHLAKIPYHGIAICERVPEQDQELARLCISPQEREETVVAGEQYLDNAAIQGVHNPTAEQNRPSEVPDYERLEIQGVHNPTAGQNYPSEVPHYQWPRIQGVYDPTTVQNNPTTVQNYPSEVPHYEWPNGYL